jgi:hypothetical protein
MSPNYRYESGLLHALVGFGICCLFCAFGYVELYWQEHYMEEALKMRNLLQEFEKKHGVRHPSILGVREHIFTGR